MSVKVSDRDTELINKTAKYYVEYNKIITLEQLRKLLNTSESIRNELNLQIRSRLLIMTIEELLKSVKSAEREKLTYREYSAEIDQNVYGALHVPLTLNVYSQGLYAYLTTKNTSQHPAYMVLGALIRKVLSESFKFIEEEFEDLFKSKEYVRNKMNELESYVNRFPEGEIREPKRYDPPWLTRALEAYYVYRRAEFGTRGRKFKEQNNEELYSMLIWKLYEILTFYVAVKALNARGYTVELKKFETGKVTAEKGDRKYVILFNSPPENSKEIVKRVDDKDDYDINNIKGRPDLSFASNEEKIVFECKYSTHQSYITAGRFKALAYIYEFGLRGAILVFPGIENERSEFDDEGTIALVELAEKSGNVLELDLDDDNRKLFLLVFDPLKSTDELISLMGRLFDLLGL